MGRSLRSTRDGKRTRSSRPDTLIVDRDGTEKRFPDRDEMELTVLGVRGRQVSLQLRDPRRRVSARFRVSTEQVVPGRIVEPGVGAVLEASFQLSARRRREELPGLVRTWRTQENPQWKDALREVVDLLKVREVMES